VKLRGKLKQRARARRRRQEQRADAAVVKFYHAGHFGRPVGSWLLPPSQTGVKVDDGYDTNFVYVTASLDFAVAYAAMVATCTNAFQTARSSMTRIIGKPR
jgi:hypothetical protein